MRVALSAFIALQLCLSLALGPAVLAETVACRTGTPEYRFASIEKLINDSSGVALISISSFETEGTDDRYDGVYRYAVVSELKPISDSSQTILGMQPLDAPPQHYFDITRLHESIDPQRIIGGYTGVVQNGDHCDVAPRFVIGYNYLVFFGVNSEIAFEPINSPQLDRWFQNASNAALNAPR